MTVLSFLAALAARPLAACTSTPDAQSPRRAAPAAAPAPAAPPRAEGGHRRLRPRPRRRQARGEGGRRLLRPRERQVVRHLRDSGGPLQLRHLHDARRGCAERVREIIEQAAASKPAPGTPEQKIGDYYASFMDEAAIEANGLDARPARSSTASAAANRRRTSRRCSARRASSPRSASACRRISRIPTSIPWASGRAASGCRTATTT